MHIHLWGYSTLQKLQCTVAPVQCTLYDISRPQHQFSDIIQAGLFLQPQYRYAIEAQKHTEALVVLTSQYKINVDMCLTRKKIDIKCKNMFRISPVEVKRV